VLVDFLPCYGFTIPFSHPKCVTSLTALSGDVSAAFHTFPDFQIWQVLRFVSPQPLHPFLS